MSSASYNFKDNLTIGNNKYLKWLDSTGTVRSNVISLDTSNNVNLDAGQGDIYINCNNSTGSHTFINKNNTSNLFIGTKLGIGFSSTENMVANVTLVKDGFIGVNTNDGYLGLSGSNTMIGSRILLHGVESTGDLELFTGDSGSVKIHSYDDALVLCITSSGSSRFSPNGVTISCDISEEQTTFAHRVVIVNTSESFSSSSGGLQVNGGVGIKGNCNIDGVLNINSVTGNINFGSSQVSSSYTTGALALEGGVGISTSQTASSVTSGGALSVAGGVAVGKNMYIGGNVIISDSTISTSAQTGSLVLYGGLGINNAIWARSDSSPQIRLAPITNGAETSISFFATNNFSDTIDTWRMGRNVENVGIGNIGIHNSQAGTIFTATNSGNVGINNTSPASTLDVNGTLNTTKLNVTSTMQAIGVGSGGSLSVSGGASFLKDVYIGGIITSSSDIRLKENIRPLMQDKSVLDIIDAIQTIKYNYINDMEHVEHIGFIAQDFKTHFPELLRKPPSGYYSLDYTKVTVLLLECIKELRKEIIDIKATKQQA